MTRSPIMWGAGLACALGGAVAGTALGSTPIFERSTLGNYYQAHDHVARDDGAKALPDHYPLVTRAGVVPVEQLSDRGLFSQARYRAFYAVADQGPGEFVNAGYDAAPAPLGDGTNEPALRIGEAAPEPPAAPPLQLDDGPITVAAGGDAKLVNVALALADD